MENTRFEAVRRKVQGLEELLVSIDWANVKRPASLLTSRRVKAINDQLNQVFVDKTLQQFLYDTEQLTSISLRLQPIALIGSLNSGALNIQSQILSQKLLSHQAYSDIKLWPLAVATLLETDRFINGLAGNEIDPDASRWYRMFALDHAVSRMYTANMSLPLKGEDATVIDSRVENLRTKLIREFEALVPSDFKIASTSVKSYAHSNDDAFLLRSAHYYGHRGNDYLSRLQSFTWQEENRHAELAAVPGLVQRAQSAYRQAINLRLVAYAKSFNQDWKVYLSEADRDTVKDVPTWSDKYKQQVEGFLLTSQALADIANQHAAMSCVFAYQYLHAFRRGGGKVSAASEAMQTSLKNASHYWRQANINGNSERVSSPYRIVQRRRLSEHMAYVVSNGSCGLPVNHYDGELKAHEAKYFRCFRNMYQFLKHEKHK